MNNLKLSYDIPPDFPGDAGNLRPIPGISNDISKPLLLSVPSENEPEHRPDDTETIYVNGYEITLTYYQKSTFGAYWDASCRYNHIIYGFRGITKEESLNGLMNWIDYHLGLENEAGSYRSKLLELSCCASVWDCTLNWPLPNTGTRRVQPKLPDYFDIHE